LEGKDEEVEEEVVELLVEAVEEESTPNIPICEEIDSFDGNSSADATRSKYGSWKEIGLKSVDVYSWGIMGCVGEGVDRGEGWGA